jgi:hypothetical protein
MKSKVNPRPVVLAALIISVGLYRLAMTSGTLSPLANFTPLGAMALFGGCYYQDKWKAYLVPLLTLWLTDIILNRFVFFHKWVFFYDGFFWVYASFALMVLIGSYIKSVSVKRVVMVSIVGALTHWIVSDVGLWLNGGCLPTQGPYIPTWKTLVQTMEFALPSMYKLLIGNLVFGALLFGCFELMQRRFPVLQLHTSYE